MAKKESVVASVLGIIFGVFLVFTFIGIANCYYLDRYVLDPKNLSKTLDFSSLIDDLKEEAVEDVKSELNDKLDDEVKEEVDDLFEAIVDNDFANLFMQEFFEATLYGDDKIDREAFEECIENTYDQYYKEHSELRREDFEEFEDSMLDEFEGAISEYAHDEEVVQIQEVLKTVNDRITIATYIFIGVSAIMIVVLALLYVNKARVLRISGISMTVAQGINLVGVILINALIKYALAEMKGETDIEDIAFNYISGIINNFAFKAFMLFGVLLAIGILAIVFGNMLIKSFEEVDDFE